MLVQYIRDMTRYAYFLYACVYENLLGAKNEMLGPRPYVKRGKSMKNVIHFVSY